MHIWVRAEQRQHERRVGITPGGVSQLLAAGRQVTVEQSPARMIPIEAYAATGCAVAADGSWVDAPREAIIFGLKELDPDGPDLTHRHIMFGHAYKGQADGPHLLARFKRGGGTLYDLEYLTHADGRRVAAFGYWAGFAGAAVGLMAYTAQQGGQKLCAVKTYDNRDALVAALKADAADSLRQKSAIIIGAKGRVGTGAADLCHEMGLAITAWDIEETAHGGPFPEIAQHTFFINCILANVNVPVFLSPEAVDAPRALRVVADIACDPQSAYNPVPIYDHATSFADPIIRVADMPPLDVMAIDNLPSMLPLESSEDYARQLLPHLMQIESDDGGIWARAAAIFAQHIARL